MSEHAPVQRHSVKPAQAIADASKDAVLLKGWDSEQDIQPFLQTWQTAQISRGLAEPPMGFDFSRVLALAGLARHNRPMLRTLPMVQRFAKDEAFTLAPEAAPTSVTSGSTEESAEGASTPGKTALPGFIVEDSATELALGQLKRSEFLAQLRAEVCRAVEVTLSGTGRTTNDCPYLNYWFDFYSRKDSAHIERTINRYAPDASDATTASGYISIIAQRAGQAAETWVRTGEVTGVPEGVSATMPGESPAESGKSAATVTRSVMFKAHEGGVRPIENPQAIQEGLGEGLPLSGSARSRMELAFGTDFSHVRTHTDTTAARLSNRLNARAFTVGHHVAFGAGEYKPGTILGDALIAHEMAHVVQQNGAGDSVAPLQTGEKSYNTLEKDADRSAMGVVAMLYSRSRENMAACARNAVPCLRSGLRLSRCNKSGPAKPARSWNAPTTKKTTTIPESKFPFGKFEIDHGLNKNPPTIGSSYGEYYITIEMTPNVRTQNADQIGFMQSARQGKPDGGWAIKASDPYMSADKEKRTDPATGWRVDRASASTDKTPFYGLKKSGSGATDPYLHANIGKFGGTKPWMRDTPGIADPDHMQFFSCAMCIKPTASVPKEKNRSYGCISWGYKFDGSAANVAAGWVEETPQFYLQSAYGAQTGRALGMEGAITKWNTDVATAGSGIDKAPTPYSLGSEVKAKVKGGYALLRLIRDSGPKKGSIYATAKKLMPGTQVLVLQRKVNRIDADGNTKDMTEIFYNNKPGWLLYEDLDFNV